MSEKEKALAEFLRKSCNQRDVCNDVSTEHCRANIVARKQAQLFYAGWNAAMKTLRGKTPRKVFDIILKNEKDEQEYGTDKVLSRKNMPLQKM